MWYKEESGFGYWFIIRHPSGTPYAIIANKGALFFSTLSPDKGLKKASAPRDFRTEDSKDKRKVIKKAFTAWTAKVHN